MCASLSVALLLLCVHTILMSINSSECDMRDARNECLRDFHVDLCTYVSLSRRVELIQPFASRANKRTN